MSALPVSSFGALLRHYRIAAGLTQEELAERSGISPRAVIALERGERRRPYRQTLQLLTSGLQLPTHDAEMLQRAAGYREITPAALKSDAMPSAALLGRSQELAAVEEFLQSTRSRVLIFAGEPGIGKSRLLQEAANLARAGGYTVLQGGGQRRSEQQPYAPLLDTLAHSLAGLSSSALRAALTGCAWLARLLPELTEIARVPFPAGALAVDQERRLVCSAVAHYLCNVAGPAGTLLVLDDLQWSGADGLDLLASLVRAEGATAIRVVGAYRDTEVDLDHPLSALLGDLAERRLTEHLRLDPLGEADAMALLDSLLPTPDGRDDLGMKLRIIQRSGGVPFFLVSCVHGLDLDRGEWSIPWTVAQSVQQRVAALPVAGQAVVRAAAIVGREVQRSTLLRMVGAPEDEVLAGLDAACRARLLLRQSRSTYRFAHDVVRESIEATLGDVQRIPLHLRVAGVLEELPEAARARHAAELAWHFQEGDRPDRALPYAVQAGDQAAAVAAYAQAQQHYRAALELARTLDDDRAPIRLVEAEILEKLSALLAVTPSADEVLKLLQAAATIYRTLGDRENETRIIAQIGRGYYWGFGATPERIREGIAYLRQAQGSLGEDAPPRARAALSAVLSHLLLASRLHAECLQEASAAMELARRSGDDGILAEALTTRAVALIASGREEEGLRASLDALQVAERADDHFSQTRALYAQAALSFVQGRFEECRHYTQRACDIGERIGHIWVIETRLRDLGLLDFVTGDWQRARQHWQEAIACTSAVDQAWREPATRGMLAWLDLSQGDTQAASLHSERGDLSAEGTPHEPGWDFAPWILAEFDLLEGRAQSAIARLEPFRESLDRVAMSVNVPVVIPLLPTLAEAHLMLGNEQTTEELLAVSFRRCEERGFRPERVKALQVRGMVLARRELWSAAEEAFLEAAALARLLPYPHAEARAFYEFGRAVAEASRVRGTIPVSIIAHAQTGLEAAWAIFRRLGAQPYIERTARLQDQFAPSRS